MDAIRDMYDLLAPDRAPSCAGATRSALAELEALGDARRARLAQVIGDAPAARPE